MASGQYCRSSLMSQFCQRTSDGLRLIKHYSPSCWHCKAAAPYYQTTYEFYYVSLSVWGMRIKSC